MVAAFFHEFFEEVGKGLSTRNVLTELDDGIPHLPTPKTSQTSHHLDLVGNILHPTRVDFVLGQFWFEILTYFLEHCEGDPKTPAEQL